MTMLTLWQTGDSCPDCGTALTVLDGGTRQVRVDCGSCGYADMWTVSDPAGGDGR